MRLKDKVSIITGGGSGFGKGIAIMFAREGSRVVIADIDQKAGSETAREIKEDGYEATFIKVDVSIASDVEAMANETMKKYGRIDVLVNNAAICRMCAIDELTEEEWDKHLSVNLKSVWLTSKYVIPEMVKGGGGAIVNIASLSGIKARPLVAAYSASKGGVIMLTQQMSHELAPKMIRCNSVSPVFGETAMGKGLLEQGAHNYGLTDTNPVREIILSGIPLKRGATPADIAYAALYLASDEASLVTGTNLLVDGGARA